MHKCFQLKFASFYLILNMYALRQKTKLLFVFPNNINMGQLLVSFVLVCSTGSADVQEGRGSKYPGSGENGAGIVLHI